ncbi:hypothetical protein V5799_000154 [Amblyomma americanum]|uniref:Uncharacterized protein n=1 Tax=Amblyomma americanum TaxID=6943 RepID=A0AAQ4D3V5_AMBAM
MKNMSSAAPRLRFSKNDDLDLLRDARECKLFEDYMLKRFGDRWRGKATGAIPAVCVAGACVPLGVIVLPARAVLDKRRAAGRVETHRRRGEQELSGVFDPGRKKCIPPFPSCSFTPLRRTVSGSRTAAKR